MITNQADGNRLLEDWFDRQFDPAVVYLDTNRLGFVNINGPLNFPPLYQTTDPVPPALQGLRQVPSSPTNVPNVGQGPATTIDSFIVVPGDPGPPGADGPTGSAGPTGDTGPEGDPGQDDDCTGGITITCETTYTQTYRNFMAVSAAYSPSLCPGSTADSLSVSSSIEVTVTVNGFHESTTVIPVWDCSVPYSLADLDSYGIADYAAGVRQTASSWLTYDLDVSGDTDTLPAYYGGTPYWGQEPVFLQTLGFFAGSCLTPITGLTFVNDTSVTYGVFARMDGDKTLTSTGYDSNATGSGTEADGTSISYTSEIPPSIAPPFLSVSGGTGSVGSGPGNFTYGAPYLPHPANSFSLVPPDASTANNSCFSDCWSNATLDDLGADMVLVPGDVLAGVDVSIFDYTEPGGSTSTSPSTSWSFGSGSISVTALLEPGFYSMSYSGTFSLSCSDSVPQDCSFEAPAIATTCEVSGTLSISCAVTITRDL